MKHERHAEPERIRRLARWLMLAIPALLVVGSGPADVAASLIGLAFVYRSSRIRCWDWLRAPWLRVAFGIWLVLLCLIAPFAYDPAQAYRSVLPWPRMILFAAALQFWLLDAIWLRRLVVSTALMTGLVALDTVWQYLSGHDVLGHPWYGPERLNGPFARPKVGIYLSKLFFPACLGLLALAMARAPARRAKPLWASGLLAGLLLASIFLSGERMALLLVLLGTLLAGLLLRGPFRRVTLGLLVVLVIIGGLLAAFDRPSLSRQFDSTIATARDLPDSHYGQIWRNSLHLFAAHPWTGIGPRNFKRACDDPREALPESQLPLRCATHSHNVYIEWLTETGIIGLSGFLVLVATWLGTFRKAWREPKAETAMMAGPLIAVVLILWPLATSGSFFTNWNEVLFWFLLGWALAGGRPAQSDPVA